MKNLRLTFLSATLLVACGIGFWATGVSSRIAALWHTSTAYAAIAPEYTVTLAQYDTTGPANAAPIHLNRYLAARSIFAARGNQRANVLEAYGYPGAKTTPLVQTRTVKDFEKGLQYYVRREVGVKSTMRLPPELMGRDRETACIAGQANMTATFINGEHALDWLDPGGHHRFFLPEFNCVTVQVARQWRKEGALEYLAESELESVRRAAPDPALFETEGEEVSPSELQRRELIFKGITDPQRLSSISDPMDKYWIGK